MPVYLLYAEKMNILFENINFLIGRDFRRAPLDGMFVLQQPRKQRK